MKYKIYCSQRNQYFADEVEFDSLENCREQLIDYHSIDCEEDSLSKQTLADITSGFEWEIHDSNGQRIDYEKLKEIK